MHYTATTSSNDHRSWRLTQAAGIMLFSGLVLWLLVMKEGAYYLALEEPETALSLRANEPTALVSLADRRLNLKSVKPDSAEYTAATLGEGAETAEQRHDRLGGWAEIALKAVASKLPGNRAPVASDVSSAPSSKAPSFAERDRTQIRTMAETALVYDPINARALRILGQLADAIGDEAKATKLMQAAAHRSLSESAAIYWMMRRSLQNKDYANAIAYADIFLRKRPQLIALAMPSLAALAESSDANARKALNDALHAAPSWRGQFFAALPNSVSDARTPLALLFSLKDTSSPPTTEDLNAYLRVLVANKFYDLAYYTWLQFLPTDKLAHVGYLTNSSFETVPSGLPFDWVLSPGSGVMIDIVAREDSRSQHALFLEFGPGRVDFHGVSQMLMLPPGPYRIGGKYKGELKGTRGLQWKVICAGNSQGEIGKSPIFLGSTSVWTAFEFGFTVPPSACQPQELRLEHIARSASEQLLSGTIWYDEFELVRADSANQ